jgi:hypothetical protein
MTRLEGYSFGRLTVDGQEHRHDLIVLPDRVVGDWWRREGHSLAMEDLDGVRGCAATARSTSAAVQRHCT